MQPQHRHRFVMLLVIAVALFQYGGSAWAQPVLTPAAVSMCPADTVIVTFMVFPSGSGPFTYQWQIQTSPNVWATLGNDPMPLPCGGGAFAYASQPFSSATPIGLHHCANIDIYQFRCVVTNKQGSVPSNIATLKLCCPADLNCDDAVNTADLLAVINAWGACPPPCPPCAADINQDCDVNVADLLAVINNWG